VIVEPAAFAPDQEFDVVLSTALATGTDDVLTITPKGSPRETTELPIQIPLVPAGYLEVNMMVVDFEHFVVYAIH
jgi:hypothetical protein